MSLLRKYIALSLIFIFAGCGFQPVYKKVEGGKGISSELAEIEVDEVKVGIDENEVLVAMKRHAQSLRAYLEDSFDSGSKPPKYSLEIKISKSRSAQSIEQDREITRYNLAGYATYKLAEKGRDLLVFKGKSKIVSSYDVQQSDFANFSAEEDAMTRIVKEMARDIRFKIVAFLLDPNKEEKIKELRERELEEKQKGKKGKK